MNLPKTPNTKHQTPNLGALFWGFLFGVFLLAPAPAAVPRRTPDPLDRLLFAQQRALPEVQLRLALEDAPLPDQEPSKAAIRQTIEHMQKLAQDSASGLKEAQDENQRLVVALNTATAALQAGQGELDGVRAEIAKMRAWGIEQQKRADAAEKESARRGNFIGILGAAVAVAGALHLMRLLPMPYNIGVVVAAAPLGYFAARLLI